MWKPNYCLQGAPSELLARARPETSQEPEGGLFPGADGSPGETGLGQNVTFSGSLAGMWGWGEHRLAPRLTHPRCSARSVSLRRQPSAHPCSHLSSSCPSHTESRPGPPSAFQAFSRQAPGYLTDSAPASPFQNPVLQPNGFAVLRQTLQSVPRPHAFVHTISSPCNVLPHSPLLPLSSLSKLPTLQAHSGTSSF